MNKTSMSTLFSKVIKIKNSFLAVFLLIQALVFIITYLFHQNTIYLIDQAQEDKMQSIIKYVKNRLQQGASSALTAVIPIANNPAIAQLVAEQDRKNLAEATKSTWESLNPLGISVFEFFVKSNSTNEWINFYRAHNPSQFGEPLQNRPLISLAIERHLTVHGLEQGHSGYSFRAAAPIYFKGKQVGVVDTGFDVGNSFLALLMEAYPGNWGLFNLMRGMKSLEDRILINSMGPEKEKFFENLLPAQNIMDQISRDKPFEELDELTKTESLYIPVRNFQGDIALVIKYVSPTNYYTNLSTARNKAIIIGLIGFLLSSIIIYILYKLITTPIKKLVLETEKIKNFQLDEPINIKSSLSEIQELIGAMASMKVGLQSFRKYTPDQLVRQLISNKQAAEVSGDRKSLTIFFSDLADFTTICEQLTPNELASQLSEFLSEMTTIIIKHEGTIDKYVGDSIMAFWGAPVSFPDHANRACLAALECQERLRALNDKWSERHQPNFKMRMGIASGEVIVGNWGSSQRLNYSVMGDIVNLASRLEGLNKEYNTNILVGQNTLSQLSDEFTYRLVDIVVVKGKTQPVPVYELVATKGNITAKDAEFLNLFNVALNFYLQRDWARAKLRFSKLLLVKPQDKACQIFLARCEEYEKSPPPDDWAGEYVYTHK